MCRVDANYLVIKGVKSCQESTLLCVVVPPRLSFLSTWIAEDMKFAWHIFRNTLLSPNSDTPAFKLRK